MKQTIPRVCNRKRAKAVVSAIALLALVFGMTGCAAGQKTLEKGSEAATHTTQEVKASDVVIERSGCVPIDTTTVGADGNPVSAMEYQYVFEVSNSNKGYVGKNVPFNVVGLDGDGNTVFSSGASCLYLYPEITTVVSGSATVQVPAGEDQPIPTVSELQIEPIMDSTEWLETQLTKSELEDMFSISNVEAVPTDASIEVTATVTGNLDDANKVYRSTDFDNTLEASVVAVFTNDEGEPMFGSQVENILIDQQTLDDVKNDPEFRNVSISLPFSMKYTNVQLYVTPGI